MYWLEMSVENFHTAHMKTGLIKIFILNYKMFNVGSVAHSENLRTIICSSQCNCVDMCSMFSMYSTYSTFVLYFGCTYA